jgi:hypothetical protein
MKNSNSKDGAEAQQSTTAEVPTSSSHNAKPPVGGSTVKSGNCQIGLGFGCLSEPIGEQLKAQGFKFDAKKVAVFEKEVDAVNQLRFGSNLLTDSMIDKIIPKLYKKIAQHVAKENKLSILS